MKIFIQNLILLCCLIGIIPLSAQKNANLSKIKLQKSVNMLDWDVDQEPDALLSTHKNNWGLSQDDEFEKQSSKVDFTGIQRVKYQQYHKDLPVIGAEYILHIFNGRIKKSSGYIFPHIDCSTTPKINYEYAGTIAIQNIISHLQEKHDFNITANDLTVNESNLCIVDRAIPNFSGNYTLAYQIEVMSTGGLPVREIIYIDALNAQPIQRYSEVCSHTIPAPASGYHYRDVIIPVDSVKPDFYQLLDSNRNIIINRIINEDPFMPEAEIVSNTDNNWTLEERDLEGAATDAMYSTVAYYEFLKDHFNRISIDDEGGPLICNVNVPSYGGGFFFVNAFWDGMSSSYGAGDCDNYGPLTTLSIVAHEFTHGLTDYTSDLVYAEESGALNESMSDIFGETLEYFKDTANFSWVIGSKILLPESDQDAIRDMSDPNRLGDPKFYKGEFWDLGNAVHTNSGVMNYWYYLIANGDSGVNEVGDTFNIEGMGVEKAIQIPYLMQTSYLTSTSDYEMAYLSSVSAAEDLYGPGSAEVQMVEDAWKAVGVSERNAINNNLTLYLDRETFLARVCLNEDDLTIQLLLENTGSETVDINGMLDFRVQVGFEFSPLLTDTVSYDASFSLDSGMTHEFEIIVPHANEIPLSRIGSIENIKVTMLRDDDQNNDNTGEDIARFASSYPSLGIRSASPLYNNGDSCRNKTIRGIDLFMENTSCATIPENSTIVLQLKAGNEFYTEEYDLFSDLQGGGYEFYTIDITNDIFPDYYGPVELVVDVKNDSLPPFDTAIIDNWDQKILSSEILDFTSDNEGTYLTLQMQQSSPVEYLGDKWLAFTDISSEFQDYASCYDGIEEHYELNSIRKGLVEFCVDTRGVSAPKLAFDAVLFDAYDPSSEIPKDFATIFEVLVDGEQKAFVYQQAEGEVEAHSLDLPEDFIGTIRFDVSTFRRQISTPHALGTGSWVLFDNIRVDGATPSDDLHLQNGLTVYPNPSSSRLFVSVKDNSKAIQLKVFNMLGQELLSRDHFLPGQSLDVSQLPEGSYYLRVVDSENNVYSRQFVVQ